MPLLYHERGPVEEEALGNKIDQLRRGEMDCVVADGQGSHRTTTRNSTAT